MRERRCIVLVPYATHVEPACERGLRELERRGLDVRRYPSTAAVDRTRCDAATSALRDGYDELMWIDSDIAFDPDDVARLRGYDLPIVAGVYAKKGVQDLAMHADDLTELAMGEGGGLYDVKYVGAGFVLVQKLVYDDIQRTFSLPVCNTRFGAATVPYFLPMVIADGPNAHWYLGEDYAFCERARIAGHKIVVDTTIRLGHIGSYSYGWEDAGQAIPRVTGALFKFDRGRAPPKR